MGMIGNSLAQGLISGANIQDGTVDTVDIKDSAVTAAKIASAVVTPAKMDFSAGTANGVAYLNGSKVLTTGSALTFDGTSLGVGTATDTGRLNIYSAATETQFKLRADTTQGSSIYFTQATSGFNGYINYDNNSNFLRFGVNGSERVRIDSSGNFGIGTNSPSFKLDVNGATQLTSASGTNLRLYTASGAPLIQFYPNAASGRAQTIYSTDSSSGLGGGLLVFEDTASSNRLVFAGASGNLGLGVTPSAWYSTMKAITIKGGNGNGGSWYSGGSQDIVLYANGYYDSTATPTRFGTAGSSQYRLTGAQHSWWVDASTTGAVSLTQAMTLDANSRLGLGSAFTPARVLDIRYGARTMQLAPNPTSNYYGCGLYLSGDVGATEKAWMIGTKYGGGTSLVFEYSTNDMSYSGDAAALTYSEKMRIDPSGNLLVGITTADGYKTVISGAGVPSGGTTSSLLSLRAGINSYLNFVAANEGGTPWQRIISTDGLQFFTSSAERARIDLSGNLLMGATSQYSGEKLNVTQSAAAAGIIVRLSSGPYNSSSYAMVQGIDGTTARFYFPSNGGLYNYSANNVNLSDERTKTDIQDAGDYLAKICAIPVRTFKYKDQTDDLLNLGVIAQEVEAIAPELVNLDGFGDNTPEDGVPLKGIYQTDLQYALMKCIQEQQAIIEQMQTRLTALEGA